MTFNQWCSGRGIEPDLKFSLEAIWNALIGGGCTPEHASVLLRDLLDSLVED